MSTAPRLGWKTLRLFGALALWLPGALHASCLRAPLPYADVPRVTVGNTEELIAALERANRGGGNVTIELQAGDYALAAPLVIKAPDITLRGADGDRANVWLHGDGMEGEVTHIFDVLADRTTIANLSAGEVNRHVVEIHAELDVDGFHAYNVRLVDAGRQIFKVGYKPNGAASDDGIIEWSEIAFTRGHAPQGYTGGIGAIGARKWVVRHNLIKNIRVPPGVTGAWGTAIQFRRGAFGNRVEKNVIINSDVGIRFGLEDSGHGRGSITDNRIHVVRDVGIGLEKSTSVTVARNTVWAEGYPNAIEYRFPESHDLRIEDNLVHGAVVARDGATARLAGNIQAAPAEWFTAPARGDLRLRKTADGVSGHGPSTEQLTQEDGCIVQLAR